MNDKKWIIRAYRPGDEQAIFELYQQVFHKPLTRAYWQWKLHTLPSPAENEWVADADGRIIGHYAVMPIRFQVDGREVIVPHGCDRMTQPRYQRRGIYSALGARANEVWKAAGAAFQFAFIPGTFDTVLSSLGWQPLLRIRWMKCLLHPLGFAARKIGLKHLPVPDSIFSRLSEARTSNDGIDVIPVERAGDEFDRLWQHLRSCYKILAVRDRAWVQWRYLDAPGLEQRVLLARRGNDPCGYLAYRIHRDAEKVWAVILDCFTAPREHTTTLALLAAARRALWRQNVESVAALVALNSPLYDELRHAGFWQQRRGFDFSIIRYVDDFQHDPRDWFITGAEGDVV